MKKVVYTSTNGVNIHYLNINGDKIVRYLIVSYDSFSGHGSYSTREAELSLRFYRLNKNHNPDNLPVRTKIILIKSLFL